jgi:predicted ferric reductase
VYPAQAGVSPTEEADVLHLRSDELARARLLALVFAVHAAAWALAVWRYPDLEPARQIFAELMSTAALVLMSLNLVLATRWRFLERRLHGLDKLFATHRILGLSVVLFLLPHVVLVPKSDGLVLTKFFSLPTFLLLLAAIFAASAPRFPWRKLVPLKYNLWKLGHRLMGVFVATAVAHSLLAETYVRQVPLLATYVYGVAALGLIAWVYRELVFPFRGPFTNHKVVAFRELGGSVSEVLLSPPASGQRVAGQFGILSLAAGPSREPHPFTISSGTPGEYRFSIKSSGDFTDGLLEGRVPIGSAASVEGPYGAFDYHRGRPKQLWLAGGIGITPFLSMAASLDDTVSVLLVWSVRDREEAVYDAELLQAAADHPNLHYVVHTTCDAGHLDPGTLELSSPASDYSAFICGPPGMRRDFERRLREMGVLREEIYFEEFRFR